MMNHPDWINSIHHDGSPLYVTPGDHKLGDVVTIRLRTGNDTPVERIFLRTCPDGEQEFAPLHRRQTDMVCQWWEAQLQLRTRRTDYRFYLVTQEGNWWLTAAGIQRHTPTDANDFKVLAEYHAPAWVRDMVFYQIFPDRFADGDPANNVVDGEYNCYGRPVVARTWGTPPQPHHKTGLVEFYGGDLPGIVQRLDYLEELGITAVYLTPIFTSPSNHKYDVVDYKQVDPHFGGDDALANLRRALDEREMRLILDMVPNHCSAVHPWFLAAQADPAASTADYFTFRQHPDQYETWLGVRSLVKLNYRSERLREEMYAGENAIMRHWLRPPFSIDGWRIDVANMLARQGENQLGHKIGRGMRRAIKAEAPNAYLLGEHFFDGTPHLQGDELDATMNYRGFMMPLLHWLAGFDFDTYQGKDWGDKTPLPTTALAEQWQAFLSAVPWQIAMQQLNLLDSHDTPRFLTLLEGDEDRARIAVTLLMTYPGVPCIYYGDEIGLLGGSDPDSRRCMIWDSDQWNTGLRDFYRQLIHLRREAPALRWGGFQWLHASGQTIAFQREAPEERLIVIARRGDDGVEALPVSHAGLPDGTHLRDLVSGAETTISRGMLPLSSLPSVGAQLWHSTN